MPACYAFNPMARPGVDSDCVVPLPGGAGAVPWSPAERDAGFAARQPPSVRFFCARLNAKSAILAAMQARLANAPEVEFATALGEIEKIAQLRLNDFLQSST